jgi:hypothetical protein
MSKPAPAASGQYRWPERRVNWPDTVPVQPQAGEASSELLEDESAAESMLRFRRVRSTAVLAVVLVAICAAIANVLPLIAH